APIFYAGRRVPLESFGARCLEGWRVSRSPNSDSYDPRIESTPIYRQSNISFMRFKGDPEHWESPKSAEGWCIHPGDVAVNKIAPIRPAGAVGPLHRHPIDGNCLLVRGLAPAKAFWLALCLNQPSYGAYLTQGAGVSSLARVSLSSLR